MSYFGLIHTFMVIFFLITCMNIPVMNNNASWSAFENIRQLSWTAQYTAGNLGMSTSRCLSIKLVGDDLSVGCNTGIITKISHFGVYAKDSEADQRSICTIEGVSVSTGLQCDDLSSFDHPIYTDKLKSCEGQQSCLLHGIHDEIPLGPQPGNAQCVLTETDSLFIQYSCVIGDEELGIKRQEALLASCVNIFAALVLLAVIKYRQGSISIEKREWDLQTVTASDYTLELKLDDFIINQLKSKIQQENFLPYESDGLRLKLFLTKTLEDIIKQKSGEEGRIADLNFAYHNSWLLDRLRDRGDCIKYQQWAELNEINKTITKEIHDDLQGQAKLLVPKCAFVSIESETAYNVLAGESEIEFDFEFVNENNVAQKKTTKIAEAPEPTNVIWENRDFNKATRYTRLILVISAVLIVLFITFLATVQAKAMTNDLIGKYDDSINCSEMNHMYDSKTLQKLAADEWIDYYKNSGEEIDRQISSTLSCFCTAQYVEKGNEAAEE